jgi:methylamine dehydrogenase heavy chain
MRGVAPAPVAVLIALAFAATAARAQVPIERPGRSERLAAPPQAHWIWVADPLLRRSSLLDLDRGAFLGMVSTGYLAPTAAFPRTKGEFYWPETYYSRGSRGSRTDVVTVYDTSSLSAIDEVLIPPKRAINVLPSGNVALSDDDRFLAVFNMTPATSLSVVDLERRVFVGEIATPGCSLVFAAGRRRFLMLCADGGLMTVTVDDAGREAGVVRGAPFFEPMSDPVTEKAVRYRDRWLFVSFEGIVHPVDVSGAAPRPEAPWPLLDEADRRAGWRVGGTQHLAVHVASGRVYSLMHQGGIDTHKEPGTELWVYDLKTRARVQRLRLRPPGFSYLSETIEFGRSWIWPFDHLWDILLDYVIPSPGVSQIQVTQDDAPLLVTSSVFSGSLAVYDALSLRFLRRVSSGNLTTHALQAPWGAQGRAP